MDSEGSITMLIEQVVQKGDEHAARLLFDRYFQQLMHVAANKLRGVPRGAEDEEDVVVDALDSFLQRARGHAFPHLHDRHNLWPLLLKITERKAVNLRKKQLAKKRGAGNVHGEAEFPPSNSDGPSAGLADFPAPDVSPEMIAEIAERCHALMGSLPNDQLRLVARLKLEGYTNQEIADKLDVVERTVERKLRLIRNQWQNQP